MFDNAMQCQWPLSSGAIQILQESDRKSVLQTQQPVFMDRIAV